MAYYDKKIVYLSCMENGSKIKGAGFIKIEKFDKGCAMDMRINGLQNLPDKNYEIRISDISGNKVPIGMIYLHKGCGEWKENFGQDMFGNTGIHYESLRGIHVSTTQNQSVEGYLEKMPEMHAAAAMHPETKSNAEGIKEKNIKQVKSIQQGKSLQQGKSIKQEKQIQQEKRIQQVKSIPQEMLSKNREEIFSGKYNYESYHDNAGIKQDNTSSSSSNNTSSINSNNTSSISSNNTSSINSNNNNSRNNNSSNNSRNYSSSSNNSGSSNNRNTNTNSDCDNTNSNNDIRIENVILNDKWEQLKRIYQVVHPYDDQREYISIQPKDFVVMSGDYQHLANNSFLLHGFYNYRHIILGREALQNAENTANTDKSIEKEEKFYLGVPGVYYEREKMVALMFGFEAFECAGGTAEAGKSGYYLRRVSI